MEWRNYGLKKGKRKREGGNLSVWFVNGGGFRFGWPAFCFSLSFVVVVFHAVYLILLYSTFSMANGMGVIMVVIDCLLISTLT